MTEANELDKMPPTREKELEDRISKLIHFVDSLLDDIKFSLEAVAADYEVLKKEFSKRNVTFQ